MAGTTVTPRRTAGRKIKPKVSGEDWIMRAILGVIALYLVVTIVLPLYTLLSKSFEDKPTVHSSDWRTMPSSFGTPALSWSIQNSLTVTLITTCIVVIIAFIYAYALTRTCIPFKGLFKGIALIPILMPSLLPAIALVYFFGNQGIIKSWLLRRGFDLRPHRHRHGRELLCVPPCAHHHADRHGELRRQAL